MYRVKKGFTLAEMMVVMLIMSIILAAMAPVMTTRSKADSSSPWRYSPENLSDAYFGPGDSQIAMIGQPNKLETDDAARLILNTSASLPVHMSFKRDNTTVGRLQFWDTNLVLGSGSMDHLTSGGNNVSIGPNNLTQVTSGNSNIAIGDNALISNTSGNNNIGIGTTLASNEDGDYNVAVGDDSLTKANNSWNTAIGTNAYQLGTGGSNTIIGGDAMSQGSGNNNSVLGTNAMQKGSGDGNVAIGADANNLDGTLTNTVAIGFSSESSSENSISLGYLSKASNTNSISIGKGSISSGYWSTSTGYESSASGEYSSAYGEQSNASGDSSIALGNGARSFGGSSVALGNEANAAYNVTVAIGHQARAIQNDDIAIGNQALADGESAIAIGSYNGTVSATATGQSAIAIGDGSQALGSFSVALGTNAGSIGENNIGIGTNACKYVTGSNKVCIGVNSGPTDPIQQSDTSTESLYFGSSGTFARRDGRFNSSVNSIMELHKRGDYALAVVNADLVVRGDLITMPRKKSGGRDARYGGMRTKYIDNQIEFDDIGDPTSNFFSSDRRLKYVGKENSSGLNKIKKLKVFNYTYKKDKAKTPHVGVIAQDLQKVFPDAVKKGKDGFLTIRFEDIFFAMVNAIKELDARLTVLEKENQELKARIEKLEAKIK